MPRVIGLERETLEVAVPYPTFVQELSFRQRELVRTIMTALTNEKVKKASIGWDQRRNGTEDKRVEPSTGCSATDFESTYSPFASPPERSSELYEPLQIFTREGPQPPGRGPLCRSMTWYGRDQFGIATVAPSDTSVKRIRMSGLTVTAIPRTEPSPIRKLQTPG